MAESLFDIFGDHIHKQTNRGSRQRLANVENMVIGKKVSSGPLKPNEPAKSAKKEVKKSFLNNAGATLQSGDSATPHRRILPPSSRAYNIPPSPRPYDPQAMQDLEELHFTEPKYTYDNFHSDALDYLPMWEPALQESPPRAATPEPMARHHSMELIYSHENEFFSDDMSDNSVNEDDLGLPAIF